MPRIDEPKLQQAYDVMRNAGPRGRALAALLDERKTRVRSTSRVSGGFTLNFINTIFLQPLSPNASELEFRQWVTILAHEACHIEQRGWVDSVQQEIKAYQTQCCVANELEIDLQTIRQAFVKLNPDLTHDQRAAQSALVSVFFNTPAAIVYASLPLRQPHGMRAILPGLRELFAVVRAGWKGARV